MHRRTVVKVLGRPRRHPTGAEWIEAIEPRRLMATVIGVVFDDLNGNGVGEAGEPAVAGVPVYVDLNNDGAFTGDEPAAASDATGYSIEGVPVGTHTVRVALPADFVVTTSPSGAISVTVANPSETVRAGDFGRFQLNTFTGEVYHDANGDGRRDVQEFGLPGWRAFADRNANGQLDAGEPSGLTDAEGLFHLGGIGPGTTVVRVITPAGWVLPATSNARVVVASRSGARHAQSFPQWDGIRVRGRVLFDTFSDRNLINEPGLGGRWVYVDTNQDGSLQLSEPTTTTDADGNFGFIVAPGTHVIRPVPRPGDVVTVPSDGRLVINAVAGEVYEALPGPIGINRPGARGGLFGHTFDDRNRNGTFDLGEPGAPGRLVYLDANNNAQRDAGETATNADWSGYWAFPELAPGTYVVRQALPDGSSATAPAGGGAFRVSIANNSHVIQGLDFGAADDGPTAVVNRRVFYNNGNIDRDARLTPADDGAIADDKVALRPGQAATMSAVTGYTRGINGVMIDVARLPADRTLTPDDFVFKAGTSSDPSTWAAAPAPTAISVRRGGSRTGPDRITLAWADGSLRNTWLQVTLRATANSGLAAPDVFYFGNLVGASGTSPAARPVVTARDYASTRAAALRGARSPSSPYDHNRDGLINALDVAAVRANIGRSLPLLSV